MSQFGVIVTTRTALPSRGATTHSDTLFLACKTEDGPLDEPFEVFSMYDFEAAYAPREGMTVEAYDYLDVAFREGLKRCWVGRYETNYTDAFDLFDPKLGCGQLAVLGTPPGRSLFADMQVHATAFNRVALRDVSSPDDSVVEMEAMGDEAPSGDEYGATFGSWVEAPGPAGVYGAGPREVQATAVIAGMIARADANGNVNRAAAGDDFPFRYCTGIINNPNNVERAGLWQHGVNAFNDPYGVLENYGFQTNKTESVDNPFWQFNCSRGRMYLVARAEARGQKYMFRNIDGQGHLAGALQADLLEEFKALYDVDGLFGATPQDAYAVEVGASVNTIDEIAQGHLHAVAAARFSLHTKAVMIELVSVPITGSVIGA